MSAKQLGYAEAALRQAVWLARIQRAEIVLAHTLPDLRCACLLGEMPHVFAQLAFPRASLAVLETFVTLSGIEIDLSESNEQSRAADEQLGELLSKVHRAISGKQPEVDEEEGELETEETGRLSPREEQRIERLFVEAKDDRSKAYELKSELDQLNVFADYEERFLDLFKKPET